MQFTNNHSYPVRVGDVVVAPGDSIADALAADAPPDTAEPDSPPVAEPDKPRRKAATARGGTQ